MIKVALVIKRYLFKLNRIAKANIPVFSTLIGQFVHH